MPGQSQPGGQLAGAASGRQTRRGRARSAAGPGRVTAGPMTGSPPLSSSLEQDTSSKSNKRLEIARFLIGIR
eukprot:4184964-Prymnesium_polylepis.1